MIILLLVLVVALAIGLVIVGRSVNEISTSNKTEESSRAFSAAEAGIEKALRDNRVGDIDRGETGTINVNNLNNNAGAEVKWDVSLPRADEAFVHDPISRESFGQVWFADPDTGGVFYDQNTFDVYFGQTEDSDLYDYSAKPDEKPALEINIIYKDGLNGYKSVKDFYDSASGRIPGFTDCTPNPGDLTVMVNGVEEKHSFYCKFEINLGSSPGKNLLPVVDNSHYLVMARFRMLYTNLSHPFAVAPRCEGICSLPPQKAVYKSAGSVSDIQRTIQVSQYKYVMPHLFDYVLFSATNLDK